jgi:hypothetical protein
MNNESERIRKQAVVTFEALFRHLPGGTEQNYERNSTTIVRLKVEVSTWNLLNRKQECYPFDPDVR